MPRALTSRRRDDGARTAPARTSAGCQYRLSSVSLGDELWRLTRGALPFLAAAVFTLAAGAALADPCEGALPRLAGERFAGQVRYIGDGDSLCVGDTADQKQWIEVRLGDFDAPELNASGGKAAKDTLSRIALGASVTCVAVRGRNGRVRSYDRVIARCDLEGRSLGELLLESGLKPAGR